jgi:NADPH-dependent 2,4-dienoyl-CoA reductase/sulfur reductase-like enzyme
MVPEALPPVVVGAGPAGIRAAATLARAGLRPVVIDEAPRSGGQIYRRQPPGFTRGGRAIYGLEADKAARVHGAFDGLGARIDDRPNTLVWSIRPSSTRPGRMHLLRGERAAELAFTHAILATGAMDRVIPFPGWTIPGVFTLGGAQVALKYQGCAIGRRVVFLGTGPLLYLVAYQYARAGAMVAAVLDTAPVAAKLAALPKLLARAGMFARGLFYLAWLRSHGVTVAAGVRPVRVEGGAAVTGLVWRDAAGRERRTECDAVGSGFGLKSETQLADLAEVPFDWDELQRQWLPRRDDWGRTPVAGIYLAGDGAGILGADAAELAGERAALALLADRGMGDHGARVIRINAELARHIRFRAGLEAAFPFPADLISAAADDTVLCRCENISAGELRRAARDLGADEVNRAKAFSRVGMGRCQGRVCGPAAAEILAHGLGVPIEQAGRLRGQAPVKPLPIAAALEPTA